MSNVELAPSEEAQIHRYDADYTASLIVNSFFFSQGDVTYQHGILSYLVSNFRDHFDEAVFDEATNLVAQRISRTGNNRKTHREHDQDNKPIDFSEAAVKVQASTYSDFLKNLLSLDPEEVNGLFELPKLRKWAIAVDIRHLGPDNGGGGRNRKPSPNSSPYSDGHLSQWVYFGLMGQTTRMPEYDQMFADMVSSTPTHMGKALEEHQLPYLINYHIHFHPDQKDHLPDWAKKMVVPGSAPLLG